MKKFLCLMLISALICASAMAEMISPASAGEVFELGVRTPVDLDGDGAMEEVILQMEGVEYEEILALYVFGSDGAVYNYEMYVSRMVNAFSHDINEDGKKELFICGDFYSDDYITYCLAYDGEIGLISMQFANLNRYEVDTPHSEGGYGMITAIDGANITLTGSQDVLGTWFASRVLAYVDGKFEPADDGTWRMVDITGDDETWEYRCLELKRELPVKFEDGGEGVLPAGSKFVVTQSDLESTVYFKTEDGKTGSFAIEPNVQNGWGSLISGMGEDDWFEYVPYAD